MRLTDKHLFWAACKYAIRGSMEGSAYRDTRYMVERDRILFVHEWCREYVEVYVIPAGVERTSGPMNRPASHGSAMPAYNGVAGTEPLLCVANWRGDWTEGPWKERAERLLADIVSDVAEASRLEREGQDRQRALAQVAVDEKVARAIRAMSR